MLLEKNVPVITIDGPSGSGKGTIGSLLARELVWHFLDSGIIYRVYAWLVHSTLSILEEDKLIALAGSLTLALRIKPDGDKPMRAFYQGCDITDIIRTEEMGRLAAQLGTYPKVRQALLAYQRAFRKPPGLVADGRDMGSVVFPDALLKIFLIASLPVRAKRRYLQLKPRAKHVSLASVRTELKQRDNQDEQRLVAPLKPTEDAFIIDTSYLSIPSVLQCIKSKLQEVQRGS